MSWKRFISSTANNKRGVFHKWFVSYLLMLLLPILVSFIFYAQIEKILIDNALRSQATMLEQVGQVVDHKIKELDQLTLQISLNPELKWMLERNVYDDKEMYELVRFVNELSRYNLANSFISEFYLYMVNTDTILSSTFKTNLNMLYPHSYQFDNFSYTDYIALLQTYHYKRFYPSKSVKLRENKRTNVLTYVHSLPIGNKTDVQGSIVVHIHENQIKDLILRVQNASDGTIFILDNQGELLLASSGENQSLESLRQNKEYIMASITSSQENRWTYVSAVPKSVILSKINDMKLLAIFLIGIIIVLGFAASYLLTRNNYHPIKQLVQTLTKGSHKVDMNEIDFIYKQIVGLSKEGEELKLAVSQFKPVVRTEFVNRLLRGQVGRGISSPYLESIGVPFQHEWFGVVIFDIDDCSGFIKEDTEQEWALIRFVMMNLMNELMKEEGYAFELEQNRMILILNQPDERSKDVDHLMQSLNQMKEFLEQRFRTVVTIAVSGMHEKLDQVARCYGEAIMAMDYKMIMGEGSILNYIELQKLGRIHYQYPLETELQLINYAKVGDINNVRRLLGQIREANFTTLTLSPEMIRCLFVDMNSTLMKLVASLNIDEVELFGEKLDPIGIIEECSSVEEMVAKVDGLYLQICTKLEGTKLDSGVKLLNRIMKYTEKHYRENSFSLTAIADHFGLHSTYLSSFFKKQSGGNLSIHINNLRMDYARRLLRETTLTVSEIAQQVGYANHIGFIRAFKKVEGITPGQYRELS